MKRKVKLAIGFILMFLCVVPVFVNAQTVIEAKDFVLLPDCSEAFLIEDCYSTSVVITLTSNATVNYWLFDNLTEYERVKNLLIPLPTTAIGLVAIVRDYVENISSGEFSYIVYQEKIGIIISTYLVEYEGVTMIVGQLMITKTKLSTETETETEIGTTTTEVINNGQSTLPPLDIGPIFIAIIIFGGCVVIVVLVLWGRKE